DVRPQSSFPASMSVRSFKAAFPPSPSSPMKSFRVEPSLRLGDTNHSVSNGSVKPTIGEASAPSFGAGLTRQSPEAPSAAASVAAAKSEAIKSEPIKSEPAKPEPVKSQSAKSEPGKFEATAPEPDKSTPSKSAPEVIAAMPASADVGMGAPP